MVKAKLYLSLMILLASSMLGANILLKEDKALSEVEDNNVIAYVEDTTTTSTSTTTPTATTTVATTAPTTTTKVVSNDVVPTSDTLSISNSNKTFYLKKDDGSYSILKGNKYGMIDYRLNFNNNKVIIYGHSNPEGTGLFQYFQNFDGNKSFYNNHKYLTVTYEGNTYTYEIFSVYVQVLDSNPESTEYYMNYGYASVEDYNNTLQGYKNKSQYDTGVEVTGRDKILIIQTCSMNKNYKGEKRLLIMAKRI